MRLMNALAAKLDLVAVQAPSVDRRALSQAWYDALHLARAGSGTRCSDVSLRNARHFRPGNVGSPTFPARHPWLREKLERPPGNVRRITSPSHVEGLLPERRARISSLARDIVARVRARPNATRFVFELPQGRVCLYVVRGERHARIAAFCAPSLRDTVEKALMQVRFAL